MKLSEAILLGDTLKKCDSMEFLTEDGSCGCALGGALLACGASSREFHAEMQANINAKRSTYDAFPEITAVKKLWPWLTPHHVDEISSLYMAVERRDGSIEEVADYVRSIEPAEEHAQISEPITAQETVNA